MSPLWTETLLIGLGTYLMRALSLSFGSRAAWPAWVRSWLSFITPAVLGALLGPQLLLADHQVVSPLHNPALWAAVPTAFMGWWKRSLFWTVAVGVAAYAVTSRLIG
jgi:branched-subunit amino acid transport protein